MAKIRVCRLWAALAVGGLGLVAATGVGLDAASASGLIAQSSPIGGSVTAGSALSDQLVVTGNNGAVTFTQSTGTPQVTVSTSGAVSAPGSLPVGTYTATGTDTDPLGDTGTWSYQLTVLAGTIAQSSPTGGSVTAGSALSDQLVVTGNNGAVTFTQSTGTPQVTVSTSGAVSAPGSLPVGTYTATGTDTDPLGDTGTWSYQLTVLAGTIAQSSPTGGSVTAGSALSDQLVVTGNNGAVTFTQSAGTPQVTVSTSGAVSAPGSLPVGTYTATGTDTDPLGDTGTWSYQLTVLAGTIAQSSPTGGSVTAGSALSDQLVVTGNNGAVTFTQSTGTPQVTVSTSGEVSAPGSLPVGTYTATGTDTDPLGDTGTWSYQLTVLAGTIAQSSPTGGSVTAGSALSDQLVVTGNNGAVTFTQSTGTPQVTVSTSGEVSAPGSLPVGTYTATGTDTDPLGDTGTWSYQLTVLAGTIAQSSPIGGSVTAGSALSDQLVVTGNNGAVTFTQSTGTPQVTVSTSGAVSAPGSLPVGTYTATGTDTDPLGDTGTWSYQLTVLAGTIAQSSPTGGSVTAGSALSDQLVVTGNNGAVTFTQSAGTPQVTVSTSGAVSAPGSLPVGTYRAAGTDRDVLGDTGSWGYVLVVTRNTLFQGAPFSATISHGAAYSGQLMVRNPVAHGGLVAWTTTVSSADVSVSTTGHINVAATVPKGTYRVSGTESDALGDSGTWSFSVTVLGLQITTASLPNAVKGTTYPATTLVATGGITPYHWSISSGSLPRGLTLNASTGKISGTVLSSDTAKTYDLTIEVTDHFLTTATRAFQLRVVA